MFRKDRLNQKRTQAAERQAHWHSLTPAEKIQSLDNRLGIGVGATKQRAKLAKLVSV